MKLRSITVAATLAFALAGCWKSERPLMGAADRDEVDLTGTWSDLGDGGSTPKVYRMVPGDDRQILAQRVDGASATTEYTMSLDWLDGETRLAQVVDDEGGTAYQLLIGDPAGDRLRLVTLACNPLVLLEAEDVTEDAGDCMFGSYPALRIQAEKAAQLVESGDADVAEAIVTYTRIAD